MTRKHPFARCAIAALSALAMAAAILSTAAVPARAGNDDLARAIAAFATVAIVGTALHQNQQNAVPFQANRTLRPMPVDNRRQGYRRHQMPVLPAQCAVELRSRHGTTVYYAERCLRRNGVDRLPQRCTAQLPLRGRYATVYQADCLIEKGYRLRNH